ncbi:MAG: hypothetical protein Q4B26_03860 [Eubacteriales bacterium]|nr:hypothetical protein [Eubacteriales bacterium]
MAERFMKKAVTRCMVILMLLLTVVGVKRPEKIYAAGVSEAVTLKKDGSWVTQQVPEQTSENFWYKVEIPSVGNLNIKVENALERGLKWNLYTEDLGKVASNSYYYLAGGETGRKTYALSPGRYYLNVYVDNREKSGKFKVSAAFAAFKGLEDQKAVSFVSPQVYTVGKTVRGAITHTEKEDWYRFSVSEEGEYTVNVVTENIDVIDMIGGRPFEVNLNDSSNVRMSYSNYWPGDTLKITRKLTPGTYYINIKIRLI